MKTNKKLTQEHLKKLLHYDKTTGIFTWRASNGPRAMCGYVAGGLDNGYISIRINGKKYFAHRLAYFYVEGFFPVGIEVDHINRIRDDNRWENLRLVSHQCNIRNAKKSHSNTSGVTGVHWDKQKNKWKARIQVSGKNTTILLSKSFDEAVLARLTVETCLNWNLCNSKSPAYQYAIKHGLLFCI